MASLTKKNGMAASKYGTKNGTKAVDPARPPARTQRKVAPPTRKPGPQVTGGGFSTLNLIGRLIAWYALYTVLFRCPPVPAPDSPTICHPAHTITAALRPHVQPYYKAYAAPHVQEYSPYVQRANKNYIIPAYNTIHASYRRYGEPCVAKGSGYAVAEYNRFLKPHVAAAQSKVEGYVNIYVSPHAEKASKIWTNDVKPSVVVAEHKAGVFWNNNVLPSYDLIQPYLSQVYEQGKYVILTIVAPVVREGGEKAVGWGRGMWSEVVRPQVGRISERLGGTNGNGVPASVAPEPLLSSLSPAKQSEDAASISSMISSASASKASDEAAGASVQPKKMTKAEAKEMIKNDLLSWSAKFKSSSAKTVADLRSQIDEISGKAHTDKQDSVETELASLQKLVDEGLANLRAEAIKLASQLKPESAREEKDAAVDKLLAAARLLGARIRDTAQSLRKDAEKHIAKLYVDVSKAADQHLDVLDSVNDLGMQELGMKWAWMDYVGYKDWAKYHDLKKEIKESRAIIIESAESNEKLLEVTQWVESAWEGRATEIAKEAAEALKQVKEIGKKKIELADASGDSTDGHIPSIAEKAAQQVLGGAGGLKNAIVGEEKQTDDIEEKAVNAADEAKVKLDGILSPSHTPASKSLVFAASSAVQSVISQSSRKVCGTEPNAAERAETALSEAIESASSVASVAAQSVKAQVPGGVHAGFVVNAESIVYEGGEDSVGGIQSRLSEASKAVSRAVKDAVGRGTTSETALLESLQSRASCLQASAVSAASSVLYGNPTPVVEEWASIATDKYSAAVAAASSILYGTPTPTCEVLIEQVKVAYSRAIEQVRSVGSEKICGTPVPSDVPASVDSLISKAAESIASAADTAQELTAARYAELRSLINELMHGKDPTFSESVMNRFSSAFYGSPTPLLSQASSFAASATAAVVASMPPAIDAMVSNAVSRVKAAAAEASIAIYGKEPIQVEKYQQQLRQLGKDAVDSVSAAVFGTEKGTFERAAETAASIASQASENAANAASQASLAASSTGVKFGVAEEEKAYKDQLVENASRRIWNAIAAAEETLGSIGERVKEYAQQAEETFEAAKGQIKDEL